jgi:hypothetical protein
MKSIMRLPNFPRASLAGAFCGTALAGSLALGCGGDSLAPSGEELGEDPTGETQQPFNVWFSVGLSLMPQVKAGSKIRVCIEGPGLTTPDELGRMVNLTQLQWLTAWAVQSWVDGMRPTSKVPLITASDVVFDCVTRNLTINVHHGPETLVLPHDLLTLSTDEIFGDRYFQVMVHEFGHVFGLADTYTDASSCQPGQPRGLMCEVGPGTTLVLLQDDINGIQEAFCSVFPNDCKRRWEAPLNFCTAAGAQLKLGTFNGADSRSDLLCHNPTTGARSVMLANSSGTFANPVNWSSTTPFCAGSGNRLHLGDFNGDNRTDLLCHTVSTGAKAVALASTSGTFPSTNWSGAVNFCAGSTNQLFIADVNGDNRDDLVCHDTVFGAKAVALATTTGTFPFTNWFGAVGFCAGSHQQLLVGNFNASDSDKRDDLLCHNINTGEKAIAFPNFDGSFNAGASWTSAADLNLCTGTGWTLLTGDFNGDGRSDILCHEPAGLGQKRIAFATTEGTFVGSSRYWSMNWCNQPGAQLSVGNFDGATETGNTSDFLCHYGQLGIDQIAYQSP